MNISNRDIEQSNSNNASFSNSNSNIITNTNQNKNTNNINIINKKNSITNIVPPKNVSNANNNVSNNITINNNSNNNTIQVDDFEKIQKKIMEHFQNEINLKKKIIEKEEIIENMKNELCEKEYELFHANIANQKALKNEVEEKRDDIKDKTKKINKGYVKQNELITKRKQIQATITKLSKNEPNNPQIKNLFNIYKYYLNLLENMNTEHRKFISMNEIKRKEKKIGILTEQLDLRDMYIKDAYKEIELNKCDFNYKNPKIISSEEIDLAPIRPPIVKISPSFGSLQNLAKNLSIPKTESSNKLKSIPKNKDSETKSNKSASKNYRYSVKSDKFKEILKEQMNLKKLNEIKKNIVTNTKISKKRQFGDEILALFKFNPKITNIINNNNGFDQNLFGRKKSNSPINVFSQSTRLINAGEKAVNQNRINNFTGKNAYNN
jgi:hypothetical protein